VGVRAGTVDIELVGGARAAGRARGVTLFVLLGGLTGVGKASGRDL
jgi:hypothetical protein